MLWFKINISILKMFTGAADKDAINFQKLISHIPAAFSNSISAAA